MFCYQCEQTAKGVGCNSFGVCGKDPDTAALQDLLIYAQQGAGMYAKRARDLGASDREVDRFMLKALFATVTNVNFDPVRVAGLIRAAADMRDRARNEYEQACAAQGRKPEHLSGAATWTPAPDADGLIQQGEDISFDLLTESLGADRVGLLQLLLYGLKGMAAYAEHALILGKEDASVYEFMHRAMNAMVEPDPKVPDLLSLILECGKVNLRVMELLDEANTGAYGNPVPTPVAITPVEGKAILVSGHDLKDLEELLKQTEGTGVHVYTHGEMLPAHGYPGLKKYPHLVGNYGGAWQDQRAEFDAFPGAILMTTNCLQKPKHSYAARLFTCGLVAWPDVRHIDDRDFKPVIEAALTAPGFPETSPLKTILVGFGHNTVLGVAPQVVEAVKTKAIRRFFLIGGCDGAKPGRDYFTRFAEAVPKDAVILTLACGKFRFNKMDFGQIAGLPRLLDVGQCNDAYSAIRIASALAEAFGRTVNELPLSLILSWYEQKAVCVLLTLLHLGIRNIRLGPSLPAFITPSVLRVLVEQFGIRLIGDVEADLEAALAGQ